MAIENILAGGVELDEILVGGKPLSFVNVAGETIFVFAQKNTYNTPGVFNFTLSEATTGFYMVTRAGGGGGENGSGSFGGAGSGGTTGSGIYTTRELDSDSPRNMRITVGAGGRGGTGDSNPARNGDPTLVVWGEEEIGAAVGGVAGASSSQNGTAAGRDLSDTDARRLQVPLGTRVESGPAGTGNGGSGQNGGGGAGGNGGIFGNYSNGGKGGDGSMIIVQWGILPD